MILPSPVFTLVRACLRSVCLIPLSLHSETWTEDVQSDVHRVCPCSRDVVLSATFESFAHVLVVCPPGPGSISW